jgi:hypothetical protein
LNQCRLRKTKKHTVPGAWVYCEPKSGQKFYAIVSFCGRKMRIGLLLKQVTLQLLLQGSLRVLRRRRRRRGVIAAFAAADTLGGGAAAFAAAVDG